MAHIGSQHDTPPFLKCYETIRDYITLHFTIPISLDSQVSPGEVLANEEINYKIQILVLHIFHSSENQVENRYIKQQLIVSIKRMSVRLSKKKSRYTFEYLIF